MSVPATWWRSVAQRSAVGWRGVEAQHIIATLRLVDSPAEQQALEQWLEESKPPLPPDVAPRQHYLLTTPFRYRSLDALVGNDDAKRRAWMEAPHRVLNGVPRELVRTPQGMVRVLEYLDGMRAPI